MGRATDPRQDDPVSACLPIPRRLCLAWDGSAPDVVRDFVDSGKPVASICHGPWNLVEADRARGRRLTSWPSVRTDLRNAGAVVVDEEVVTDGNITTSRSPQDLPAFCDRIVREFASGTGR
jgi:protease I